MTEGALQGERQEQIMIVLWHNGEGCVEHVRAGLPARHRGAYSTVQTVPNRLVDRGLPTRERRGKTFVYTAQMTEGQYLSRSIEKDPRRCLARSAASRTGTTDWHDWHRRTLRTAAAATM